MSRRSLAACALLVCLCGGAPVSLALATASLAATAAAKPQYYVSLGDSYAVGYQGDVKHTTHNGPADQLVQLAHRRGYDLRLVNLGCGGATTTSLITQEGCRAAARAPGAPAYPGRTQVQAAVRFVRRHPGQVRLVTISIGGNDVTPCIPKTDTLPCARRAMRKAAANLHTALRALRKAGGPTLRIVGSTYPDVVLGAWVRPDVFGDRAPTIATLSLTSFARIINPTLRRTYGSAGAAFVDVTRATGAYGPFTTEPTKYGQIPTPVATVCRLTYFCSDLDIHMTTRGYGIIARLEVATLPRMRADRGAAGLTG